MEIRIELESVYEEIMWLAARPNITPSVARSWYTHATAERLKKHVRKFTGSVSKKSLDTDDELRLEHYLRIQTRLTSMVRAHIEEKMKDPDEFVNLIFECEQVHIVTRTENYSAMKAKGDYSIAGIELVEWEDIDHSQRCQLWEKMLRGKVSNYKEYKPHGTDI